METAEICPICLKHYQVGDILIGCVVVNETTLKPVIAMVHEYCDPHDAPKAECSCPPKIAELDARYHDDDCLVFIAWLNNFKKEIGK